MSVAGAWRASLARDRALVLGAALLLLALSWGVLLRQADHAGTGVHALGPHAMAPGVEALTLAFVMWLVMMVAMMLPAVLPWILLLAAASRERSGGSPHVPAASFAAGYFAVWAGYSLAAAAAQLALQQQRLLGASLRLDATAGGALLLAAGLFQLTPLKTACLAHCRSPLGYFLSHWREGRLGAFEMGARHGGYCLVCCWALMALGFALGVMNLAWMGFLAAMLALEQAAPRGRALARGFGVGLAVWGLWLLRPALPL